MTRGFSKWPALFAAIALVPATAIVPAAQAQNADAPGKTSPEQMQKALGQLSKMLKDADANEDGSTTKQEFATHRAEQFSRLDANSDGVINKKDKPRRGPIRKKKRGQALSKVIPQYDTDLDGTVTRAEWNTLKRDPFEMLDANGDGAIETAEIPAVPEPSR